MYVSTMIVGACMVYVGLWHLHLHMKIKQVPHGIHWFGVVLSSNPHMVCLGLYIQNIKEDGSCPNIMI
jgi:hypothetical protein